jgi:predicted transcriptional regulator
MATDSIKLPEPLLAKVREAAARAEITPEELVRGAVEDRLSRGQWRDTLAFGERNAKARNLKPDEAEIAAERGR